MRAIGTRGEDPINVVHGRDDGGKVGGASRKEQSRVFKNLVKIVRLGERKKEKWLTFNTSRSSVAITHSAGTNSCFRRSRSRMAVIESIAERCWIANSSMSNVEFQRVATSRGIIR